MDRRTLIQASIAVLGGGSLTQAALATPTQVAPFTPNPLPTHPNQITASSIVLYGDAAPISPTEQIQRLSQLASAIADPSDRYLKGGAVAMLETRAAAMFGKSAAAFFPTGTMANNVGVRLLCGDKRLMIAQRDSHLYADESNAPAILSGLNVVPMAPGRVCPTSDEVRIEIDRWETGFFAEKVGAISLESPVRAHDGAYIPMADVAAISAMARDKRIGMHWDGARALLLHGTPGFDLQSMSAMFDTIMVSLDKYLDAPTGALLIGESPVIEQARHVRHVFGGLIDKGWQLALPPLAALPTFKEQYRGAHRRAAIILAGLRRTPGFEVRPIANGTNITFIQLSDARLDGFHDRLLAHDVRASVNREGLMTFYANATLLRRPPEEILRVLRN